MHVKFFLGHKKQEPKLHEIHMMIRSGDIQVKITGLTWAQFIRSPNDSGKV